jgi:hypothetical protein
MRRRQDLLPGVSDAECPPIAVIESRVAIHRARRKAALHDFLQLLFVGAVDYLVLRFPAAHVPYLGRHGSLVVVGLLNAAMLGWLFLARLMPYWRARRIAATWSSSERSRFSGMLRRP